MVSQDISRLFSVHAYELAVIRRTSTLSVIDSNSVLQAALCLVTDAIVVILLEVALPVWQTEETAPILQFVQDMLIALTDSHVKGHPAAEDNIFVCVYATTNSHNLNLVSNLL